MIEPEINAFCFDVSDAFEVYTDLDTAVQDMSAAEVEQLCSIESQQWRVIAILLLCRFRSHSQICLCQMLCERLTGCHRTDRGHAGYSGVDWFR